MFAKTRHIVTCLLLTSYIFVGAVAHLRGFGNLFSFDSKPQKVEQSKSAPPSPVRVFWTQHKHIPSVTKALSAQPALVTFYEWPQNERVSRFFPVPVTRPCLSPEIVHLFPRAPPFSSPAYS